MASITAKDVRDVVQTMTTHLAPATVRTDFGVLRAIMSAAVDANLIAANPCRNVGVPTGGRAKVRFLSAAELERLAQATPPRYRAAIYLAGAMGLRWSEVAGLRVSKVDFLAEPSRSGRRWPRSKAS
jgi:integrase